MMYKSGFVVVVKDEKGRVLREKAGRCGCNENCYCGPTDPSVYLPFNSHYSLLLKNNNKRKAVASIYIDGTEVIANKNIIIPANSSVEVERFCIDGNLNNGRKFYFVPNNDSSVSDPTNNNNGLIEVVFRLELEKKDPVEFSYYNEYINNRTKNSISDSSIYDNAQVLWSPPPSENCQLGIGIVNNKNKISDAGATVEGDNSNQRFAESSVGKLEVGKTVILLQLKGLVHEDRKKREGIIEELKKNIKELEKKIKDLEY